MYINVYNVLTTINNKYQLNADEIYTYMLITYASGNNNSGILTTDYLDRMCDFKKFYKYSSRKSRNVKKLESLILSLKEKNVIVINGEISEMFEVEFIKDLSDNDVSGYEKIESSLLEKISKPLEAYVYITILKWNTYSKEEYSASYEQWAKMLGCSIQTSYDVIWNCSDKLLIEINQGKYIQREDSTGVPRQGNNKYKAIPLSGSKQNKKPTESKNDKESFKEEEGNVKKSGWFEYGNITVEDMKEYILSDNPNFRKVCENKMNDIDRRTKAKGKDFTVIKEKLHKDAIQQIEKEDKSHAQSLIDEVGDVVIRTKESLIPFEKYNNETIIGFWYKDEQTSFSQTTNQHETTMKLKFISDDTDIEKIINYRPIEDDSWKSDENDNPFAGLD